MPCEASVVTLGCFVVRVLHLETEFLDWTIRALSELAGADAIRLVTRRGMGAQARDAGTDRTDARHDLAHAMRRLSPEEKQSVAVLLKKCAR